ncbi:MAG TPA: response regulator [Verrucomicrobiae bacterium]|nr:response regulator [Verrucomicrobiae bacterium]
MTTTASLRVLLVDDDPLVCDSIRRMLEFDQHKVKVTTTAADALNACEIEKFDFVILDYLMPVMKGDKLALALKERFPDLPILMVTADAEKLSLENKPAGVDLLLGKPFQLAELREAIGAMLRKE